MKAINCPFTKLLNNNTQFIIPVFQRDYSWTETQCEQLWKDVVRIGACEDDTGQRGHFIGSIVHIPSPGISAHFTQYLLIDGQQRLTTLFLLLVALRKHILAMGWESEDPDGPTPRRIRSRYLLNSDEEGERQYKLLLRRHDHSTLKALIDDGEISGGNGSACLVENLRFFRDKLVDFGDPDVVYRGIGRLVVVDVALERGVDDPQSVFESLNSTGLALTQSDLIRNFMLMDLQEREQTRLYEEYWAKIEALFKEAASAFDTFIRDYMALRTHSSRQSRANEIYQDFRAFFRSRDGSESLESLLADMHRFATYYVALTLGGSTRASLKDPLRRLGSQVEAAAITVMRLSDCHYRLSALSERDFVKALSLLESYVFRRSICGLQTRGYWQVFARLANRIKDDSPLLSLEVELHLLEDSYRFPADEEFSNALQSRDLYNMRVCRYLLERLENADNREVSDTSMLTIEHVMPQNENLKPEWRAMLGNQWQEVHREWVDRLGNLTLTGYNAEYSDRPYSEKRTIPNGFLESSLRLNSDTREHEVWTESQMKQRGENLAKRALAVWPTVKVSPDDVRSFQQEKLRKKAEEGDVSSVPMSEDARSLFEILRPHVCQMGSDVVEMAETRSVGYHVVDYFVEVLPRRYHLELLLNLDYNEAKYLGDGVEDASRWKFFVNATHLGGVYFSFEREAQLESAVRVIREAYERAKRS